MSGGLENWTVLLEAVSHPLIGFIIAEVVPQILRRALFLTTGYLFFLAVRQVQARAMTRSAPI
ncbi:hypothetical protein PC128_g26336 [Phytophthora cactorum]|nr:hypothetical protein PC120_g26170 [Phytophthora cactorum]KAG3133422.1 hypothetical protein PC128_g26336 [Phytophthora cactorum]